MTVGVGNAAGYPTKKSNSNLVLLAFIIAEILGFKHTESDKEYKKVTFTIYNDS